MTLKAKTQGKVGHPTLLFLHAFPFSSAMWQSQISLFSEKFHCVALDLPGFGESSLPNHAVTFEHYIDSTLSYLKEAKVEKAIVCGLSMGGYLALRLYERAPELFQALVLCDTKAGPDGNEAKIKRWDSIKLLQKSREEFVAAQWKALTGEDSKKNAQLKNQFEELISNVKNEGIAAGLVALATRNDSAATLPQIKVPTLILVGEQDQVTPVSESDALNKAIPGSQLKIIQQAGHLSNLENPQQFNDRLSEFLVQFSG